MPGQRFILLIGNLFEEKQLGYICFEYADINVTFSDKILLNSEKLPKLINWSLW